jgi:hypothetical protein
MPLFEDWAEYTENVPTYTRAMYYTFSNALGATLLALQPCCRLG